MGKLILEIQTSIDGFIADHQGKTNWMIWNWGPEWTWDKELQSYHIQLNKTAEAILISSQMAQEGFNLHWQKAAENPEDPRYDFARHISNTTKYIATKSLTKDKEIPGGWLNIEILTGDLMRSINELKDKIQGNIIVYGGAKLVSGLISANLIDTYYLFINPVALGHGLPIFISQTDIKLIKTKSFECGVVVTQYEKMEY